MTKVICFTGLQGSGKSTTAKELARALRKLGQHVVLQPLAKPVKELANQYFDLTKYEDRLKLEDFAEELKFMFGADIYAKYLCESVTKSTDYLIIPDLRFVEEINCINDYFNNVIVIEVAKDEATEEASAKDKLRLHKLLEHTPTRCAVVSMSLDDLAVDIETLICEYI